MKRFAVSVPATSANLGPGFDAIGLALDLRMRAEVVELERGATPSWTFRGSQAPTHDGLRLEIARAIAPLAPARTAAGPRDRQRGTARPRTRRERGRSGTRPRDRGRPARTPPDERELARTVTVIEGHPDNGIPAVVGGVVIAAAEGDDVVYTRFDPPPDVRAIVVVPQIEMPTRRRAPSCPTIFEGRCRLQRQPGRTLSRAFASGRVALLRAAMRDRMHQPYRATFVPGLEEMLALEGPDILGIALSGAGPSVLALARPGSQVGERIAAIFTRHGIASRHFDLALARDGIVREG